jgi:hypothetical protein
VICPYTQLGCDQNLFFRCGLCLIWFVNHAFSFLFILIMCFCLWVCSGFCFGGCKCVFIDRSVGLVMFLM